MTKNNKPSPEKGKNQADKQVDQLAEMKLDLQRVRADFENYRKRTEQETEKARKSGADAMVIKLLPIIDTFDRALGQVPNEIADNNWVKGMAGISKNIDKILNSLDIKKIKSKPGSDFNPELHYAIQVNEDAEGEREVIEEELQAGYSRDGVVIRHAMVKVTRK